MKPWLLLGLVALTFYGYDPIAAYFPDPVRASRWLYYIFQGVLGVYCLCLVLPQMRGLWIGLMACWVGIYQETETAVCGIVAFGSSRTVPAFSGLCVERFGIWPYAAGAALIAVVWWRASRED